MNTLHADAFPGVVEIVVEIPRGSRNKYEYDEEAHVFRLDRVLSSAVFYNFDYGFIEGTRADDGDHTDALLIIDEPTFTGCHVWGRPIGGLEMHDEHGFDFKTLCDLSEPLEVISSLQALVAAYEEVLERHGMLKVKTVGDSLMAVRGLFPQVPNPALESLRCAFELKETAAKLRPQWNLRLGLHVGPVVAGVVGRKRYQFDLWGSTVHTAAEVKARGAVNAVNVSAAAWQRVAGSAAGNALEGTGGDEAIYRVDRLTA